MKAYLGFSGVLAIRVIIFGTTTARRARSLVTIREIVDVSVHYSPAV